MKIKLKTSDISTKEKPRIPEGPHFAGTVDVVDPEEKGYQRALEIANELRNKPSEGFIRKVIFIQTLKIDSNLRCIAFSRKQFSLGEPFLPMALFLYLKHDLENKQEIKKAAADYLTMLSMHREYIPAVIKNEKIFTWKEFKH